MVTNTHMTPGEKEKKNIRTEGYTLFIKAKSPGLSKTNLLSDVSETHYSNTDEAIFSRETVVPYADV